MPTSLSAVPEVLHREAPVRFEESTKGSIWFITKGVILSFLTVGIYRFWFATAVRKNLWARAFIDGSPAEYTGQAKELLLGFLVTLMILLPAYVIVFIATMVSPYPKMGFLFAYVLFFLLLQIARYRARRYLASRTVWRGIRFRQDGSALAYTTLAAGWWIVTLLTLGIGYPFMRASLERYRINHTRFGEARLESEADGGGVIFHWLIVWALGILPVLGCVWVLFASNNFRVPTQVFAGDSVAIILLSLTTYYRDILTEDGLRVIALVCAGAVASGYILRPYYHGRESRAFLNAIKLNRARVSSKLSVTDIYVNYFGFYFFSILLFASASLVVFCVMLTFITVGIDAKSQSMLIVSWIASYCIIVFGMSWLYFRFLQVGRLAIIAETLSITGAEALDAVTAVRGKVEGRLAEGLADAVDPGGIEIGF